MEFFLSRFCYQPAGRCIRPGVFGQLTLDDEIKGYTVEQPWNNNLPFKSCVPDGAYTLVPYDSKKYGKTFVLVNPALNVYAFQEDRLTDEDRYACLFVHVGNFPWNFQGCIGLGHRLATDSNGQLMVTNTADTCEHFLVDIPREEHTLIIHSPIGAI